MKIFKKKGKIDHDKNWTEDIGNFRYYVGADFVDQLQSAFDTLGITRRSFAKMLNVSEGRVSQVFNEPGNLTLDTMIKWSKVAGLKTGVVLYHNGDLQNQRGPISGRIFVDCWKKLGSPYQMSEYVNAQVGQAQIPNYSNPLSNLLGSEATCETHAAFAKFSCTLTRNKKNVLQRQYGFNSGEETNSLLV